jgi:hypothetical protein
MFVLQGAAFQAPIARHLSIGSNVFGEIISTFWRADKNSKGRTTKAVRPPEAVRLDRKVLLNALGLPDRVHRLIQALA